MVAKRNAKTALQFDPDIAQQLHDAAADEKGNRVPDVIASMLSAGIPPESVACDYIPHVARQMGEEWCDDSLSFSRVTIGTARLQSSLRTLGKDWSSHGYDDQSDLDAGLVIVIAKDSFHTLGAMVLCGQLRRAGLSVRLAMGIRTSELAAIFENTAFDAALISASSAESLESLRDCVDIIRKSSTRKTPVIIGGSVLDNEGDVRVATGADHTTRDPFEALEHCGIKTKTREEARSEEQRG